MSQSGAGVGTMSHKCGKYESEWSECEKKRKESVWIVTNPSQEWREQEEDKIGGMPPKAVTPVDVSLRPIWDDLLYLPQWMDTEVTVGVANVRLVDQELYIITKFLVEMQ